MKPETIIPLKINQVVMTTYLPPHRKKTSPNLRTFVINENWSGSSEGLASASDSETDAD